MLRRNACYGPICAALIAAGGATAASAPRNGADPGIIVAAPDPCAAPADIPVRPGAVDAEGRPVISADVPATAPSLGDVPVAIVTDLGAQAGGGGSAADPRFETFGYPAALTVQGNRVIMNGRLIAPDPAEADAARRAACARGDGPAR
jgi:hypothetical protein